MTRVRAHSTRDRKVAEVLEEQGGVLQEAMDAVIDLVADASAESPDKRRAFAGEGKHALGLLVEADAYRNGCLSGNYKRYEAYQDARAGRGKR